MTLIKALQKAAENASDKGIGYIQSDGSLIFSRIPSCWKKRKACLEVCVRQDSIHPLSTDIKSAKISAEDSFSIDLILNICIDTNVLKKYQSA